MAMAGHEGVSGLSQVVLIWRLLAFSCPGSVRSRASNVIGSSLSASCVLSLWRHDPNRRTRQSDPRVMNHAAPAMHMERDRFKCGNSWKGFFADDREGT